ncbi:MAG: acylglycerol kinase family protein, partial [Bacteroidaceae bacterium]|nr:acylglycerol kinase family protein [Bacteroidaceae bacterium]
MNISKKKILAIINPISGTRTKYNIPKILQQEIDSDKFELEIVYTEYAGHATILSNQAVSRQYAYVLSVGGDGTCNEIAKTLIHTNTVLGIIPVGSGNGLARHLGIPMKI